MIKIKMYYDYPEELSKTLRRLGSDVKSCKKAREKPTDKHKRAYIILKD